MGKYFKREEEEGEIKLYARNLTWEVDKENPFWTAEERAKLKKDKGSRFREEILFGLQADFEEDRDYNEIPDTITNVDEYILFKNISVDKLVDEALKKYYINSVLGLPTETIVDYELRTGEKVADLSKEFVADLVSQKRGKGFEVADASKIEFAKARGTDIAKQNIKNGIEEVINGNSFQSFLDLTSNFKNYSFNNKMLVYAQCPNATMVKGGKTWKENFERYINKGEKAIWIYTPFMQTFKEEDKLLDFIKNKNSAVSIQSDFFISQREQDRLVAELREKGTVSFMTGFSVAPVYDITQTNGKELDLEFVKNIDKTLNDFENIKDALVKASEENNKVKVSFSTKEQDPHLSVAYGYYSFETNAITISTSERSEQDIVKTLVHEMAHSMLHGKDMKVLGITSSMEMDKSIREVEAEAVAYMVCGELGIDSGCRSFGYIAEYLPLDKDLRNKAFEISFKRIEECSKQIMRDYEKNVKQVENDLEVEEERE